MPELNQADEWMLTRSYGGSEEGRMDALRVLTLKVKRGEITEAEFKLRVMMLGLDTLSKRHLIPEGGPFAIDVNCPWCPAPAGRRCVTEDGVPVPFHQQRVKLAADVRAERHAR